MGRRESRCEGVSGESCKIHNMSGQAFARQMIPEVNFIKTLGLPLEGDPIVLAVCLAEKPPLRGINQVMELPLTPPCVANILFANCMISHVFKEIDVNSIPSSSSVSLCTWFYLTK